MIQIWKLNQRFVTIKEFVDLNSWIKYTNNQLWKSQIWIQTHEINKNEERIADETRENLRTCLRQEKKNQMQELKRINQTWFGIELWYQMIWTSGIELPWTHNQIETYPRKPRIKSRRTRPVKILFQEPRFGENTTKGFAFNKFLVQSWTSRENWKDFYEEQKLHSHSTSLANAATSLFKTSPWNPKPTKAYIK